VHIDRLILDGLDLDAHAAQRLRAAVETELSRLIACDPGSYLHPNDSAIATLQTPDIQVARTDRPATVGQAIAGALHGGSLP
jgi:hypothetical protein